MVDFHQFEEDILVPGHCSTPGRSSTSAQPSQIAYAEDRVVSSVLPPRANNNAAAPPTTNPAASLSDIATGATSSSQTPPIRSSPHALSTFIPPSQLSVSSALVAPEVKPEGTQMATDSTIVDSYSRTYVPPTHRAMRASGHRAGSALGLIAAGVKPPPYSTPKGTRLTQPSYPSPVTRADPLDPCGMYSKAPSVLKSVSAQSAQPPSKMSGKDSKMIAVQDPSSSSSRALMSSGPVKPSLHLGPVLGYKELGGMKIPFYAERVEDPIRNPRAPASISPPVSSSNKPMTLDGLADASSHLASATTVAPETSFTRSAHQPNENLNTPSPLPSASGQTSSNISAPKTLFEVREIHMQSSTGSAAALAQNDSAPSMPLNRPIATQTPRDISPAPVFSFSQSSIQFRGQSHNSTASMNNPPPVTSPPPFSFFGFSESSSAIPVAAPSPHTPSSNVVSHIVNSRRQQKAAISRRRGQVSNPNAQIVREDRVFHVIQATHDTDIGDLPMVPERVPEEIASQAHVTEATRDNDEGDLPTAPAEEAEEVAPITEVTYDKDEGDLPIAECSSPAPNIASEQPIEVVLDSTTSVENNEPEQIAPESPAVEQAPSFDCSPVVESNESEPDAPEPEITIIEKNNEEVVEPQFPAPVVNNVEESPSALEVPEPEPESTLPPSNIEDSIEPQCSGPALDIVEEETPVPLEVTEPEPEPKPKPEQELECTFSELNIESDAEPQCSSHPENIENDGESFVFHQEQPELEIHIQVKPKLRIARSISPTTIKRRGETDSEAVQRLGSVVSYLQTHNTKLLGIEKDRAALSALESVRNENVKNYIHDPTAAFASMSEQLDQALCEKRKLAEQDAQLAEEIAGEKKKREKVEEWAKRKVADLETRQQEKLEKLRREKRKSEDASALELKAAKQQIEQLEGKMVLSEKMLGSELEEFKGHIVQLKAEKKSAEEKLGTQLEAANSEIQKLKSEKISAEAMLGSQLEEARRQIEQLKAEKVELASPLFPVDSNIEKNDNPSPNFQINPTLFTGNWDILVDVAPSVPEPEIPNVPVIPSWIWDLGILVVMTVLFYFTCFSNTQLFQSSPMSTFHIAESLSLPMSVTSPNPRPSESPFSGFTGGKDARPSFADLTKISPPVTKALGIRVFDIFSVLALIFWWMS